jgi:hypothetical protein
MAKQSGSKQSLSPSANAAIKQHSRIINLSVAIGLVAGIFFWIYTYLIHNVNPVPITGPISMSRPTILVAAAVIFVLFWYFFDKTGDKMVSPNRMGLIFNSFILSVATSILGVVILALFAVAMSDAFEGLKLGILTSTIIVGSVLAATTYFTVSFATYITLRHIFNMLMIILFGGILASAIAVGTPDWYNVYLSALGMESAGNVAKLFNFSLAFAGIMLIALANVLFQSVREFYVNHPKVGGKRFNILYTFFVLAGIFLAGIGLFPFVEGTTKGSIHILSAALVGAVFVIWTCVIKWLIPFFDRSFYILSAALGVSIAVIYILSTLKIYFNVTGEELTIFVIATVWLSLLLTNMINATLPDTSNSST